MKTLILATLIITVWKGCTLDIRDTSWEVYSLSMSDTSDDPLRSMSIGFLVDDQIKGTVITIRDSRFKISGDETKVRGINSEGNITTINSNEVVVEDESGQKHRIQYKLSADKKTCDFTLGDGSTLHTFRIQ